MADLLNDLFDFDELWQRRLGVTLTIISKKLKENCFSPFGGKPPQTDTETHRHVKRMTLLFSFRNGFITLILN